MRQKRIPAELKVEPANPSAGVNGYLLLGIKGLMVSALGVYYQRAAIMSTLQRTPAPDPKPNHNLWLMDWKFLHNNMMSNFVAAAVIRTAKLYGI